MRNSLNVRRLLSDMSIQYKFDTYSFARLSDIFKHYLLS